MITLGIETSCDETALAIIETRENQGIFECRIIASLIHSQAELHSAYGGVYPTLAKREHSKNLVPLLKKILSDSVSALGQGKGVLSSVQFKEKLKIVKEKISGQNDDLLASLSGDADFLKNVPAIDMIAVTEGPGLEPALWVGINFGSILSELWSVPLVPVNHMEGHIVGSLLQNDHTQGQWQRLKPLHFPALALLISGGHTELVKIDNDSNSDPNPKLKYTIIGQTKDDAVGEAFDKVARLLGLPYPGGPHISKLAEEAEKEGITCSIKLPRPMITSDNIDFSFSGLKTAVLYAVRNYEKSNGSLDDNFKKGLAREFELAVKETLQSKLRKAIEEIEAKTVIAGGGVIANKTLRKTFEDLTNEYSLDLYLPSQHVSGDNALMIALVGALDDKKYERKFKADGTKRLNAEVQPWR